MPDVPPAPMATGIHLSLQYFAPAFRLAHKEHHMAKGQQRGNKEVKKPKKEKTVVLPAGTFITPTKPTLPHKQKH